MAAEKSSQPAWTGYDDDKLLKMRICDLKLKIEGTELEARVATLYKELEGKGLSFKPKVYLGDEWFSPEGVPAIAMPFFLAHPRLRTLERKMMFEVEGDTLEWCLKLLRHECGHCFDHAFGFSKRRKWQKVFGSPRVEYEPDHHKPRPYSRSFVRHLDNWYAQSHPDEDFAETFAVWLNPNLDWRKEYAHWQGALRKLEYVESLVEEVGKKEPRVKKGPAEYSASRIRSTLGTYYQRKKKEYAEDYPDFYDADLSRIFDGGPDLPKRSKGAARFLSRNRKSILNMVARWTGAKKHTVNYLFKRLILRCEQNELKLGNDEESARLEVATYLTTLVTHYLITGRFTRHI